MNEKKQRKLYKALYLKSKKFHNKHLRELNGIVFDTYIKTIFYVLDYDGCIPSEIKSFGKIKKYNFLAGNLTAKNV